MFGAIKGLELQKQTILINVITHLGLVIPLSGVFGYYFGYHLFSPPPVDDQLERPYLTSGYGINGFGLGLTIGLGFNCCGLIWILKNNDWGKAYQVAILRQ